MDGAAGNMEYFRQKNKRQNDGAVISSGRSRPATIKRERSMRMVDRV
jgi:hypothetical protein